jgi:pyridoxal phosphate enzyme (YggS family)
LRPARVRLTYVRTLAGPARSRLAIASADGRVASIALTPISSIAQARAEILGRVADAAARSGRAADDVQIVAVTKTVDAERIREAAAAGFRAFGENRVQERQSKADALADLAGEWHLVGPLQSNKVRKAVELFDVIESVDSLELAQRLDRIGAEVRQGKRMGVLLQVNVDQDPAKSGYSPAALDRDLDALIALANIEVGGLMTVGRQVDDAEAARSTFVALRTLSERLRGREPRLGAALSMGMTEDYPIAVEEGATIVRIGRAVFGSRPAAR